MDSMLQCQQSSSLKLEEHDQIKSCHPSFSPIKWSAEFQQQDRPDPFHVSSSLLCQH